MILPMLGEGEAEQDGVVMDGASAMRQAGIALVELRAKEGLSLINGTQCMTSVGVHALADAINLLKAADVVGALTIESLRGIVDAFDPRLHDARMQPGQIACAENLRRLLEGSAWTTH